MQEGEDSRSGTVPFAMRWKSSHRVSLQSHLSLKPIIGKKKTQVQRPGDGDVYAQDLLRSSKEVSVAVTE